MEQKKNSSQGGIGGSQGFIGPSLMQKGNGPSGPGGLMGQGMMRGSPPGYDGGGMRGSFEGSGMFMLDGQNRFGLGEKDKGGNGQGGSQMRKQKTGGGGGGGGGGLDTCKLGSSHDEEGSILPR